MVLVLILARGLALFLGAFGVVNAVGGALRGGFDANGWLLSAGSLFVGPASALVLAWALFPAWFERGRARWARLALLAACALLFAFALRDVVAVLRVFASGRVDAGFPLPASGVVAVVLLLIAFAAWRVPVQPRRPSSRTRSAAALGGSLAAGAAAFLAFPLLQMATFGRTDYRRPADAIVVFGARAYADGRPSLALEDRVLTGVELYGQRLAPRLILSGGPGDGVHHEVEVMRALAVEHGVPTSAIELDYVGLDTASTVRNAAARCGGGSDVRVLAVSQWYHLPRIKMTFARAGLDVSTVPARQTRPLRKRYWFLARETAAFWVYWARG